MEKIKCNGCGKKATKDLKGWIEYHLILDKGKSVWWCPACISKLEKRRY